MSVFRIEDVFSQSRISRNISNPCGKSGKYTPEIAQVYRQGGGAIHLASCSLFCHKKMKASSSFKFIFSERELLIQPESKSRMKLDSLIPLTLFSPSF